MGSSQNRGGTPFISQHPPFSETPKSGNTKVVFEDVKVRLLGERPGGGGGAEKFDSSGVEKRIGCGCCVCVCCIYIYIHI